MDIDKIKKLDSQDVYSSIRHLPNQIKQAQEDISSLDFPKDYYHANNIAIAGMGGSIYSCYVVKSLFNSLRLPVIKINDYFLPKFINEKTFFVASSYSGTTEETLINTEGALSKTKLVSAVTVGDKLGTIMEENSIQFYKINPKFNPSGQPRLGVGYMVFGVVFILARLGFLELDLAEFKNAIDEIRQKDSSLQSYAEEIKNLAKEKSIIFVSAEHLEGNIHISRNQLNETAKSFAEYHIIPEMNHHLLEGLTYPKDKKLFFVFYSSGFFNPRNKKRLEITYELLKKQNIEYTIISLDAKDKLQEFLAFLQFGSYLSFFLAIERDLNPSLIPYVDYFKEKLG